MSPTQFILAAQSFSCGDHEAGFILGTNCTILATLPDVLNNTAYTPT